ncbi:SAM-dependent methyltransferase [Pseudofrankia asymbiotica]|uniref:SAM-dependent methyltransferase n=1 Tax=Pseudofrankia asymbiotica TaxID=1834516 RepID=UPI0009D6CAD9|nr:SAM-dependent methyltransferase [Pseudofrankia asymbiotica]
MSPSEPAARAPERTDPTWLPAEIDTSTAHPARRYDYWLGGKDNFKADRESGDAVAAAFPEVRTAAIENRAFMRRVARFLAGEAGIDQFLDIGTGIPTSPNLHEIAQSFNPTARVVYVDNDPIVLAHARARLDSDPNGSTVYLDADIRRPDDILAHPDVRQALDFSRPLALMVVAVLHFVPDADDPYRVVSRLVSELPPGSYVVLSHATSDFMPPSTATEVNDADKATKVTFQFRGHDEFARFFDGLEIMPPGITSVAHWHADDESQPRPTAAETAVYGAVARVP